MNGGFLSGLLDIVQRSGPAGALIASGIVGLAFAVILLAHFKDLWVGVRGRTQEVAFRDKLLNLIDKLTASEDALRKQVDELSHQRGALQDDVDELRVSLSLLRSQRRRLIDYLRIAHGKPLPGASA